MTTLFLLNNQGHYFAITSDNINIDSLDHCTLHTSLSALYTAACRQDKLCLDEVQGNELVLVQHGNKWSETIHGCTRHFSFKLPNTIENYLSAYTL
jgi:hypothetical protein